MVLSQSTAKIRKILVDNQEYCWTVVQFDTNHAYLKICLSPSGENPWLAVKYRFDNPWIGFGEVVSPNPEQIAKYLRLCPVQPRLIAQIIRKVNKHHTAKSMNSQETLNYLFNMDGQLEKLTQNEDINTIGSTHQEYPQYQVN
ncbi:hypothetical protein [Calothrix sp. NIES-3974]|uniref:hypothetical protein n=1 Tax=Calothrix sp. NIES-3974 TaxID=2005462 RepID=UPI000B5DFE35|nr:hypothetical protein [Calothrix sp. NIES-3974]BAZ07762.1 hypothetical protein NIES3974_44270 [Calothrix sp. NIES-3974]